MSTFIKGQREEDHGISEHSITYFTEILCGIVTWMLT